MAFGMEGPQVGLALALSGGGFRAALYHLGAVIRLNELGYLAKLERVASVSGGSILAGYLATHWSKLVFSGNGTATNLEQEVVLPMRAFCSKTIDTGAVLRGALNPARTAADYLTRQYDALYERQRLAGLQDVPRFIFLATNLETGVSFRFSKPYAGDYLIGLINNPDFSVAQAVAASSAFPPIFSPLQIEVDPSRFERTIGADMYDNEDFRSEISLCDGGVYDNLALEPVWSRASTVLVSDGGAPFDLDDDISSSWPGQLKRVFSISTEQCRALRKRELIARFQRGERKGSYWGIATAMAAYPSPCTLAFPPHVAARMAQVRTRLNRFDASEQADLINWGYVSCDASLRSHVDSTAPQPTQLPVP